MSHRIHSLPAGKIVIDDAILKRMTADFRKNGKARVKVGILGATSSRRAVLSQFRVKGESRFVAGGKLNNAEIGAVHEFGSIKRGIPVRSWLRMPILTRLAVALKAQDRHRWERLLVTKGLRFWLDSLGALAVAVVQSAFATKGFGFWTALKRRTIARKGSSAILIDSAQLRQSVTHEVTDK